MKRSATDSPGWKNSYPDFKKTLPDRDIRILLGDSDNHRDIHRNSHSGNDNLLKRYFSSIVAVSDHSELNFSVSFPFLTYL
jgi:hypothetical protein